MTASLTDRAPGVLSGRPALGRLVAEDPADFAAYRWGREALLSRARDLPAGFGDLLDEDAVDELVSRRGLRTPFLRVARDGTTFGDRMFTAGGGVGAGVTDQVSDDKLVALFADGATLVLQGLHRVWPPLLDFAQRLAADLGHPVQVNAYVTPPQSRGFDDHYDVHDVFVVQVAGRKQWRVHAPVHHAPLRDQPWTEHREAVAEAAARAPLLEVELSPGDCLYLPRGFLHAATALGGASTHLTLGVHTWTRFGLAEQLVAEAMTLLASDPSARQSLELGTAVDDPDATAGDLELVRTRLLQSLASVSPDAVAQRMASQARAAQRAAPIGPLAAARAADGLLPGAPLHLRRHLAATLAECGSDAPVLRSRAGDVTLAPPEVPAVRALLAAGRSTVDELGPTLARRLLTAAVLTGENTPT